MGIFALHGGEDGKPVVLVFFLVVAGALVLFATEIVPVYITAHETIVAAVVGLAAIHVLPTAVSAIAGTFAMVLTATLTRIISNNASVTHMSPIAAEAAITLGIYASWGLQPPV